MNIIAEELNPTWRDQNIRGGAVPGAPEGVETAIEITQYLDYLTGGYSSVGAGYPGAFGYLTPNSKNVYLSPNMSFDFTLIEYGIPVWDEVAGMWVPVPLNAAEAEQHWVKEYETLMSHAAQPIIHWPWHDYGPTTGLLNTNPYSLSMFSNTIKMAYDDNAEFITSIDMAQRMATFKDVNLTVSRDVDTVKVNVTSQNVGKFALDVNPSDGKVIQSVDNWYAYNDKKVFLDQDGGDYTIRLNTTADRVTHITDLPMRANLLSLMGDGDILSFSFEGEGIVRLSLAQDSKQYTINGADDVKKIDEMTVDLIFNSFGIHTVYMRAKKVKVTK